MGRVVLPLLFLMAAAVGLVWAGEFGYGPIVITKEHEYKVVFSSISGVKANLTEPGWDPTVWKIPLVDEVHTYDRRLRYLNAPPVEILTDNDEKLIVDYYALWRITDPTEFLRTFEGSEEQAEIRIQDNIKAIVGSTIGKLNLSQLLERAEALSTIHSEASTRLAGTGVEVIDVRLNRTELPPNAVSAAYAQMREQQTALAREHRAQGERMAREVRAAADRVAVTDLAIARAESERVRGEGDAMATRIFAAAHQKDPEFYVFVRSLEAYRKTLSRRTTMILSPDHVFLRNLTPTLEGLPAVSSGGSR